MTARLPIPNGDNGDWGDILNAFLRVIHNEDGTLKQSYLPLSDQRPYTTASTQFSVPSTYDPTNVTTIVLPNDGTGQMSLFSAMIDGDSYPRISLGAANTEGYAIALTFGDGTFDPGAQQTGLYVNTDGGSYGFIELSIGTSGMLNISDDGSVNTHNNNVDDGNGNATFIGTVSIDGVAISGTPVQGNVITALDGSTATWGSPGTIVWETAFTSGYQEAANSGDITPTDIINQPLENTLTTLPVAVESAGTVVASPICTFSGMSNISNNYEFFYVQVSLFVTDLTGANVLQLSTGSFLSTSTDTVSIDWTSMAETQIAGNDLTWDGSNVNSTAGGVYQASMQITAAPQDI